MFRRSTQVTSRRLRRWTLMLPGLTLAVCALSAAPAAATLQSVGPTLPETGFPSYYADSTGLRLEQCLDPNSGLCLAVFPDPASPPSFPDNFPDESFYWDGTASLAIPGPAGATAGQALLVMALEGAFANGEVAAGDQIAFARIRLRIKGGFANQDYTFTYPYGSRKLRTDGTGTVSFTSDIGCFSFPCDYTLPLRGEIGPFLQWAGNPAPPAGYIGNPNVLHAVSGSPTGNNFLRVNGGNNTGLPQPTNTSPGGVQTNLFAIQGKIDTHPATPPPDPVPATSFTPTSLFFAARAIATTSAAQNVNLTNSGTGTLSIASIAITGANATDYTAGPPANGSTNPACGATLAANATCTVSVTFTPTGAGARTADLTFNDNAGNIPGSIQRVGLSSGPVPAPPGTPSATLAPATLTFGSAVAPTLPGTTSASQAATLTNTGTAPLNVTSIAVSGEFVITPGTCAVGALAAGASCTINVAFKPVASTLATRSGTLTVTDDAANGTTQTVALSGTTVATTAPPPPPPPPPPAAGIAVNPTTLAFGNNSRLLGGAGIDRSLSVTNTGNAALTLTSLAYSRSDYTTKSSGCAGARAPGSSCTIVVHFRAAATGTRNATLTIVSNAPTSPTVVQLTGAGTL